MREYMYVQCMMDRWMNYKFEKRKAINQSSCKSWMRWFKCKLEMKTVLEIKKYLKLFDNVLIVDKLL